MTTPVPAASAAFLVDESGIITAWNDACEQLLGLAAGAAIGQPLGALLIGIEEPDGEACWRTLAERHGNARPVVLRHPDRGSVKAELALLPQAGSDGAVHAWVAAIENVHDDETPESELVGRTPLA